MPPSDCLRDKTLPTLAGGRSLSTTITASSIVHVGPNTAHHLRHRHLLCDVAHNRYTIEESRTIDTPFKRKLRYACRADQAKGEAGACYFFPKRLQVALDQLERLTIRRKTHLPLLHTVPLHNRSFVDYLELHTYRLVLIASARTETRSYRCRQLESKRLHCWAPRKGSSSRMEVSVELCCSAASPSSAST